MGDWGVAGVIEGFYGRPWSWDERVAVMRFGHERGMTDYLYAPKDEPLHRDRWRELYDDEALAGFARLAGEGTLRLGFAISPGLSMDYEDPDDRAALAAKVDQVVAVGVDLVCLAVDDIEVRPGLGGDHARLTTWLHDHLDGRARLVLVPTEYTGTASTAYLDAIAAGLPDDVAVGWTGAAVVNDTITAAQARARAATTGGRPPFLWDNYPVNDGLMADRLHLGPLRGRDPELDQVCSGYLANPMVQASASLPALGSIAAYLAGHDPLDGWARTIDELDVRVLAEACDGAHPRALVDAVVAAADGPHWVEPLRELATWLDAAAEVTAGALGEQVEPWVDQVRQEAGLGRSAVRVLQAVRPIVRALPDGTAHAAGPDPVSALEQAVTVHARWPAARRATATVMGSRCGFRPVLSQWADGTWRYHRASLDEDANAIDALVRHALELLDRSEPASELTVAVDHRRTEPGRTGRFLAEPGSTVTVTCGSVATTVVAPSSPPRTDRRLPKRPSPTVRPPASPPADVPADVPAGGTAGRTAAGAGPS